MLVIEYGGLEALTCLTCTRLRQVCLYFGLIVVSVGRSLVLYSYVLGASTYTFANSSNREDTPGELLHGAARYSYSTVLL